MNAKERRNYIKTNTPRVKTMAAKLKLVDELHNLKAK